MDKKFLTNEVGAPVPDNTNSLTAGERGPILLEDNWLLEKLAHFDREVIPERRMHAKGSGAIGCCTVTNDITHYSSASVFSKIGKKTKETISELKKVNWPTFKKTCKQTGTVLVVVGVFMLAVFGIDSLVAWILKLITKI